MSNGEFFDEQSEPALAKMNGFIERNRGRLSQHLAKVCDDPASSGLQEPFDDVDPPVSFEVLHFKVRFCALLCQCQL